MRQIPIFDTNIFGHVQSGVIPDRDWQSLLRHRPGHGWTLSAVTALELLGGIHNIAPERFPSQRKQVELAFALSKGRIIDDPTRLFCREVLRISVPELPVAPYPRLLSRYMDVVRRAATLQQILSRRVPRMGWVAGFDSEVLEHVVADVKKQWIEGTEKIATAKYPDWREHFQQRGKRLPAHVRRELKPMSVWKEQERDFVKSILVWMKAPDDPRLLDTAVAQLDAVLKFTTSVVREFLSSRYSLTEHDSDIFDQFQLRYLAMDRFIIVTNDSRLKMRTATSSQADRILTFEQFLGTL